MMMSGCVASQDQVRMYLIGKENLYAEVRRF